MPKVKLGRCPINSKVQGYATGQEKVRSLAMVPDMPVTGQRQPPADPRPPEWHQFRK